MNDLKKWFTAIRTSECECRLFCFPYAGGGAASYNSWKEYFVNSGISLYPIQLPGRENRLNEIRYTRMSSLVKDLVEVIQPYIHEPFAFFGHSMGALISYELTRAIEQKFNIVPKHLFLSARNSPQLRKLSTSKHLLPDEELIAELRKLGGTNENVFSYPELLNIVLPIIRSDFELFETYQYEPSNPLRCNVTVLGGIHDQDVSMKELLGWKELFSGKFSIRLFQGAHFYHEKYPELLTSIIKQELINPHANPNLESLGNHTK